MLRYLTAGESHGRLLTAVIDGMPSGLALSAGCIDRDLARRQSGWGRGARMKIEKDRVEITSGVRFALTTGAPVCLVVPNLDWENWEDAMTPAACAMPACAPVTRPRPGHADLTGGLKYDLRDLRNVLERSSARETAARVAAGSVAKRLLDEFGITVASWVTGIGAVVWRPRRAGSAAELLDGAEASDVRCPNERASRSMKKAIDAARRNGDSLGGVFEVVCLGVPPGLGSHVQWDRKLDGMLAQAVMSIQAIKGVEMGLGFRAAATPGSLVHDEIFYRGGKRARAASGARYWPQAPSFYRTTNNAGGVEGGMSNGEPVVVRAAMKPIPTLYKPLGSVDIDTKRRFKAAVERSDVCAVPAASVVAEAAVALVIASAFLDKFGGDSIREIGRNYRGYLEQIKGY